MTEKSKPKPFSALFCVVFLLGSATSACATTASPNPESSTTVREKGGSSSGAISLKQNDVTLELSSGVVADGGLLVLTLRSPQELTSPKARFEAKSVKMGTTEFETQVIGPSFFEVDRKPGAPDTERVYQTLIAVPYAMPPGAAKVSVTYQNADGKTSTPELAFQIVSGDYPSETLKVAPKLISPGPKALKRIKAEQVVINKAYAATEADQKKYWEGVFEFPIKAPQTSPFGSRRVYNGKLNGYHGGLDLKAAVGTEIHAPSPGKVVLAQDLYYTGFTVILDHGHGLSTMYGHMSKLRVKVGDIVTTGKLLGLSGATGRVTGPHLHWQARVHSVKFNPADLTKIMK